MERLRRLARPAADRLARGEEIVGREQAVHQSVEEEISDIEVDSLAICGYTAVLSEEGAWPVAPSSSWPEECPPSICQLLDADVSPEQLDPRNLSGEDTAMLAIVGLWTICGEHFMNADASN